MLGAIVGGFLFGLIGLSAHGTIGSRVMATAGAVDDHLPPSIHQLRGDN